MYWFLGDGELESNHGYIKLHTNSFSKNECEKLCKKLKFESKLQRKKENEYLVSIPRKAVSKFLDFIGDCPVADYEHKWRQVPYKNTNIEKYGIVSHSAKYPIIEKEWLRGDNTLYELAKKYKLDISGIKYHFDTHNIKWSLEKMTKGVSQYSLEGELIREWESGQQINK